MDSNKIMKIRKYEKIKLCGLSKIRYSIIYIKEAIKWLKQWM